MLFIAKGVKKMSNKMKKKELKQIQNQAQDGRSMVEMLGVLAIIGVLSIGGIVGYRWGMDKHVSNQILYEMNLNSTQLAMLLQRGDRDGVTLSLGSPYDDGKFRTVDYGFKYGCGEEDEIEEHTCALNETMYFMTTTGLPKRVCNMLNDSVFGMAYYYNHKINGRVDGECDDSNNTVTVFFETDSMIDGETSQPEESETQTPTPETTTTPELTNPICDETCPVMCNAEGKCECPGGSKLSADGSKCECPAEKPHWTGTECTECPGDSTWDSTTGECKCEGNKVWKESRDGEDKCVELVGECQKNSDCGPGEYCYLKKGYGCGDDKEFDPNQFGIGGMGEKSKCMNAVGDAKEGETTHFVGSNSYMTWWSAERFCKALGRNQATHATVKCSLNPAEGHCIGTDDNIIADLQEDFGQTDMWLEDYGDSCNSYHVSLYDDNVYIHHHSRDCNGHSALCTPETE